MARRSLFAQFRRLKVWQKCALIAVPFLLPIAGLSYLVVAQNNEQIDTVQKELRGLDYLRPVKQLTAQLAAHRALGVRAASGDKAAEAERTKVASAIDDTIREIDPIDAKLGAEFKTTEKWAAAKEAWKTVRASEGMADSVFQKHTELSAKVLDISTDVWEYSTLALDPIADTYYLQDLMIARGIPGVEDVGQLQATAATILARGGKLTLTDDDKARINLLLGAMESTRTAFDKEARNAIRANPALKGKLESLVDEYKAKLDAFTAKVRPILQDGAARPAAADVYAAGTESAIALTKLYDGFDPLLTDLLKKRAAGYRATTNYSLLGTAVGLVVVGVVVFFVTRSITRQIRGLNDLFAKIEGGDYQTRAAVQSEDELGKMTGSLNTMLDNTLVLVTSKGEKDEIQRSIMKLLDEVSGVGDGDLTRDAEVGADITGAIADSFNYTIEQLRGIISRVQNATVQVSAATSEMTAAADHLVSGSEHQTEQIAGVSAAIDQMAATIQKVSENAALSTTVASQALQNARQGNAAVRDTIDGMNRIREQTQETAKRLKRLGETSQEIGQIVQLIDDIADRTGILALNASIQAAAAGDAGRGFAVVAEEVERLAVRSTEATKQIAALVRAIQGETTESVAAMERNIQEVVSGSKVANQAGVSLAEIEGVSVKLADLIQTISTAAKQQARGSEELAKSMTGINEITQQTAAGTKQTAESVSDLARLADDLRGSVSTFRLPAHMQPVNAAPTGKVAPPAKPQTAGRR
jgi:methyl-accepting chemotaxis protein